MSNESVEKVLLTSENDAFGGHLTLRKYEIVDCGAFCEVIFFYIPPKNLLGTSSTVSTERPAARFYRVGWIGFPCLLFLQFLKLPLNILVPFIQTQFDGFQKAFVIVVSHHFS